MLPCCQLIRRRALMPFWMSAIADGSVATARLMSVAALSTASNSERGLAQRRLRRAGSASTSPVWRPTGRDTRLRALVMFWSAKASRCLAVSTLPATEASAASANWLCSAASACSDGSSPRGQIDHLLGQRVQPTSAR